ncbi:hypothetical protein FSPOR_4483 [Fusarium sporotrichioides]|uniref:Uncharacterized protein n=1 Tax=Fusarium sporotrichioides TaxID=5514 RepID=A0A395SB82_FUSSP|nr:hypothetical protein FSPOR_4483 [Fusarium sporotrichioides]
MRLPCNPLAALVALSATLKVVQAGSAVRGLEALFMYTAYRMDVEISSARAIADGTWDPNDPNAEKPWKLGRDIPDDDAHTTATDWDQPRDPNKYGHNFHSFIRQTQSANSRYPQSGPKWGAVDRWNPTVESVKDMASWEGPTGSGGGSMDPSAKFTYNGFDLHKLLGGCCQNKGATNKDAYFRFDNIYKIVGYRVAELYEKDPAAGKAFHEKMSKCLYNTYIGRTFEAEPFKIDGIRNEFAKIKGASRSWVEVKKDVSVTQHVQGATAASSIWTDEDKIPQALNTKKTKDTIKQKLEGNSKLRKELVKLMKDAAENWGSTSEHDDEKKWGDTQTQLHENVRAQVMTLGSALGKQMKSTDGSLQGCGFQAPNPPKVINPAK